MGTQPLSSLPLALESPDRRHKVSASLVANAPLVTHRYGHGKQIVVGLHGWSGDHHSFEPLLAHLPEHVSFYTFDLPGCGDSPRPKRWSMETLSDMLVRQWDALGWEEVTVLGHCSGALLGLHAAQKLGPKRIKRFVMIDAFAYFPWYFQLFLLPGLRWLFYFTAFANPLGRFLTNLSLKDKRTEDSSLTSGFEGVSPIVSLAYLKALREIPGAKSLFSPLNVTEIVYGEKTFDAVRKGAEMWQELWPEAKLHILKGAGHLPIHESTEQLAELAFR